MKYCTMNCGAAATDTRSVEQRRAQCGDCLDIKAKFTVILLRPDYMTSNYGTDVYITHVEIDDEDVAAAVQAAKREAWEIDNSDGEGLREDPEGEPDDYFCIAAYAGWQEFLYGDS